MRLERRTGIHFSARMDDLTLIGYRPWLLKQWFRVGCKRGGQVSNIKPLSPSNRYIVQCPDRFVLSALVRCITSQLGVTDCEGFIFET